MNDFEIQDSVNGFTMKLWRGERMCLIGFDVARPEEDFVGFAIEVKSPDAQNFFPLRNRLAFSYDTVMDDAVTGARQYPSTEAPFQKFRWIHFPKEPKSGLYIYRGTKMHMRPDGTIYPGECLELSISLEPMTYSGFLDIGFTRNFASSQAFAERYKNCSEVIPSEADEGIRFTKLRDKAYKSIYEWMGFEAYDLIFDFLKDAVKKKSITLDVLVYDLNEPDIVELLEKMGNRLRVIIDDSTATKKDKNGNPVLKGHGTEESAETIAAKRLEKTAGRDHVKRTHFSNLQHHKVFIARKKGKPFKVLTGSTNFSFRGLYIQANNVLVFHSPEVAQYYAVVFDCVFDNPASFISTPLSKEWHMIKGDPSKGSPPVQVCFSPHSDPTLPLYHVRDAIDQADSSVLYSIAFLSQQTETGPVRNALDKARARPSLFSYGVVNNLGTISVNKPDHSVGVVDFEYLSEHTPYPFQTEWAGGSGITIHHKFVVTDFNKPTARVYTGSSNLAESGEEGNGDNLILIEDRKVATAYAIEALRMFDHLHFRTLMKEAALGKHPEKKVIEKEKKEKLTLRKPTKLSGNPAWFEKYYVPEGTKSVETHINYQRQLDRLLFSGKL